MQFSRTLAGGLLALAATGLCGAVAVPATAAPGPECPVTGPGDNGGPLRPYPAEAAPSLSVELRGVPGVLRAGEAPAQLEIVARNTGKKEMLVFLALAAGREEGGLTASRLKVEYKDPDTGQWKTASPIGGEESVGLWPLGEMDRPDLPPDAFHILAPGKSLTVPVRLGAGPDAQPGPLFLGVTAAGLPDDVEVGMPQVALSEGYELTLAGPCRPSTGSPSASASPTAPGTARPSTAAPKPSASAPATAKPSAPGPRPKPTVKVPSSVPPKVVEQARERARNRDGEELAESGGNSSGATAVAIAGGVLLVGGGGALVVMRRRRDSGA